MKLRAVLVAALLSLATPALAAAPQVSGRAYVVQNATTGEVLLQRNAKLRVPIASITKLMTVLVTLEQVRPDEVVTVSAGAADVGESTINLRPGERLTVRELVEGALIQSANDAAVALADYVGRGSRSAFVAMMNAKARALDLRDTHFVNPDGLDAPGQYSSARDVTRLARVAMRNPLIRQVVATKDATISGGRWLTTRNDLLYLFPGLIGVKTGHTNAAGWSEVAAARGPGVTIYATLLGSPGRAERNADLAGLLAWGLSLYRPAPLVAKGRVYARARLPYGKASLALVALRTRVRTVRLERTLVERVEAPAAISLPVARGDRLGEVRVYEGDRLLASSPLVAARSVSRPGFFGRAGWYAGRTFANVWSWIS